MPITDLKAYNAKAKEKPYKIYDSEGLFLFIPISGKKVWRFKYKLNSKEKLIVIGRYSRGGLYTLKEAREVRDEFLGMLSSGLDPAQERK